MTNPPSITIMGLGYVGRRVYDPSKFSGMRYTAIGLKRIQETAADRRHG